MRLSRWLAGHHDAGDNAADGSAADLNDSSTSDTGAPFTIVDPAYRQAHVPDASASTQGGGVGGWIGAHDGGDHSHDDLSGVDQFAGGQVSDQSGSVQLVFASSAFEVGSVTVVDPALEGHAASVVLTDATATTLDQPLVPVDPAPNSEVTVVHNTSTASNNFGAVFGVAYLTGGNTVLVGATPPGSGDDLGGAPTDANLQVAIVNGSNVSFVDVPMPGGTASSDYIGGSAVTALTNGNFAVLYWGSNASDGGQGVNSGNDNLPDYYVQIFKPDGTTVGSLITLDASAGNNFNGLGYIAEDPANNGFVVSTATGDEANVVIQRFSNTGTPGASFTIPGGYGYVYVDQAGNIVETYQQGAGLTNYYAFIPASATTTTSPGVLVQQAMPASTYLNFTPDASGSGFVAFYFSGTNLMAQTLSATGSLGSPITVANVGSIATNDRPWSVVTTSDGEYAISLIPNANGLYTEYPGTNQVIKVGPSLTAAATTIYDLTTSGGSSAVQLGPWAVAGPNGSIISYTETAGNGVSTHGVPLEATVTAVSYLGSTGPVVSAANIHVSGAHGTGGAFKIGDIVTATWDNSASGDHNTDPINGVSFDFSQFGGGSAVTATNNAGIWTATYTITAGNIDSSSAHVAVTATDTSSNATTATSETISTVDNEQPVVTAAHIHETGGHGTGGAFKTGDTVTVTWDNSAGGDHNTDTINAGGVTVDFSQFGGGAAVAATNVAGVWTATYAITSGSIDTTNAHATVTVTDHVGNATTTNGSAVTVDNEQLAVSAAHISVAGAHGVGGAFKIGDIVTATWDNSASGDNNTDAVNGVTFDFSQFGGGSAVVATNNGGVWTASYSIAAGSIDTASAHVAVTATDTVGNATTTSSGAVSVDDEQPTVTVTASSIVLHAGDTPTVTFTFSEATTDFSLADITLSGGTLSGLTHVGLVAGHDVYTAAFTPATSNTEVGSVQVNAGSYTDHVGNTGSASNTVTFSGDTQAPTVTLSADRTTLLAGQTATITFTFSDSNPSFSLSTVAVSGGALGNLVHVGPDGSGNDVYTAVLTPDANNNELASVLVLPQIYSDAAGNQNGVSNDLLIEGDTLAPTVVSVAANPNTLLAGQTSTVTFTFSEALAGFALGDVTVSGGTLGDLVHVGLNGGQDVYTAIFTPDANDAELASVQVIAGSYTDVAGNAGGGSSAIAITGDTLAPTPPTVALHDDTGVLNTDHITSDPLIDYTKFDAADTLLYKVDGGGFSAVVPTFATDGSQDGTHTVSVEERDASGNISAVTSLTFTLDTIAPTLTVSADHTALGPGQTALVTFAFSEAVAGFALSDVQLSGGVLSNLQHVGLNGGHDIYTATFTPQAAVNLSDTLSAAAAGYTDIAGNDGGASNSITFTGDTNVPSAPHLALESDSGVSATDGITKDPVIDYFKSNPVDTLLFKVDGATSFSATMPSFATNGSQDGAHTVSVEEVDAGGNASAAATLHFTLDTIAPHLTDFEASVSSGSLMTGSMEQFTLGFSEAVNVAGGTPTLALNDGGSAVYDSTATLALGDTSKLVFDYVVSATDQTAALAVTGFSGNGAVVSDAAGNQADLSAVSQAFSLLEINETSTPAYTLGSITRPELHLDPTGHIILDAAASAFAGQYGIEYLYLGMPPGTPYPPVAELHA